MNEEIKLRLTAKGFVDLKLTPIIEDFIKEREKQSYLLGAVDMREAVKIEDIGVAEGQEERMRYAGGFNDAISKMDKQAQQFIDSLS